MMRFLGVFLIFTACCFTGMSISAGMRKKLDRLTLYRRMTDEIASVIRYQSLTVREIILRLKYSGAYDGLDFMQGNYDDKSRSVSEIWHESVNNDFSLSSDEKSLLGQLGERLGATDTEGQLSFIAVFNVRLEEMIKNQRDRYAVKGKLYRSVGILAGAMFGILIM